MVKEKPNSIRIYDSEGYRRRAACICVKNDLEDEVSQQMALDILPFINIAIFIFILISIQMLYFNEINTNCIFV